MVSEAVVAVIIGAYFFTAVARTNLVTARGGECLRLLAGFDVKQFGAQHLHRLIAVFKLTALLLTLHHNARGLVGEAYGGFGLIDVLTACTTALTGLHYDVGGVDFHVNLLGLGEDGNRYG